MQNALAIKAFALILITAFAACSSNPSKDQNLVTDEAIICTAKSDVLTALGGMTFLENASEANIQTTTNLNLSGIGRRANELSKYTADPALSKQLYTDEYFKSFSEILGVRAVDATLTVDDIKSDIESCRGKAIN